MARSSRRTDIRIGHDARAAATATLDIALRDGRIDLAEYERRLMVIQAAKVGDDLTPAIADLPSRPGERGQGLRISAVDREQAQVRLAEALTDGRLEAAEYAGAEESLRRAVTYADADVVVGNLDARASLVERQQAIERVEAAVAEGVLDPAEQYGRIEAVRNATTDAQVAALVADLTTTTRSPTLPARASNADREATAARLHDAMAEGFLDLIEFDERVRAAYAARLSSELTRLVADLPEPAPLPAEPPVEKPRREWRQPEEIEQRTEQMEQLAKQLARIRERADLLTTQLEQLPELAERLPPKLAARLAKRFRKLDVQERSGQLPVQYRHIADLIKQLPDQVEQVPPELVEQLAGQIAHYTEQLERLAEDVEQLTKQAKQLP